MTLIVSIWLSEGFVAQITDRQLTTQSDGRPFDNLSNKTLIYWAKDAIVSMAYTGPAYIEDRPTDSWIAWKLWGKPLDDFEKIRGGLMTRVPPVQYHIGQAIKLLEAELKTSEIARQKNSGFELHIVGWKWKLGKNALRGKKRPLQVGWMIRQEQGGGMATQHTARKFQPGLALHASPDTNISRLQLQQILEGILRVVVNNLELPMVDRSRKIEDEIVKSIRDIAAVNPFVGTNCMSVLIAPPHLERLVRVRFFPDKVYRACDLGVTSTPEQDEASFCPWIIGPSSTMAPQVVVGDGWTFQLGPFEVQLDGKPSEIIFDGRAHTVKMGFSSQTRPRRPR